MKNLYDQIIADVLVAAKKTSQNLRFWNRFTYLALSFANSANLIFIMYLVRRLSKNKYVYDIDIIISSMPKLDGLIKYFILFVSPFLLINYFFIFYKDRYKFLIERHESKNGKFFLSYFIISVSLPTLGMIVLKVISFLN